MAQFFAHGGLFMYLVLLAGIVGVVVSVLQLVLARKTDLVPVADIVPLRCVPGRIMSSSLLEPRSLTTRVLGRGSWPTWRALAIGGFGWGEPSDIDVWDLRIDRPREEVVRTLKGHTDAVTGLVRSLSL